MLDGKVTKITRVVDLEDLPMSTPAGPEEPVWKWDNYRVEGLKAKDYVKKVSYRLEQEGSDPVVIDRMDWEKIKVSIFFTKK